MTRLIEVDNWVGYAHNRIYVCPSCGDAWARWFCPDDGEEIRQWFANARTCPEHQFGLWDRDYPGSILQYPEDLIVLPRALLRRELFLTAPATAEEVAPEQETAKCTA